MIIVADSSPIISLAQLHLYLIFKEEYKEFVIPKAVYDEVEIYLSEDKYADVLKELHQRVHVLELVDKHQRLGLGEGEAQCLILYEKLSADAILLDDHEARIQFEHLGIPCLGTLAILMEFRTKEIVPQLNSLFRELLNRRRFFSRELLNSILREFNEVEL